MYSPHARELLIKTLQEAHEDEDANMARTLEELASDCDRWPEARDFFLSDRDSWPDIAARASGAFAARLQRMAARAVSGEEAERREEEGLRLEAVDFYRMLAAHHVATNPDAELLSLIHRPRFPRKRRRTAFERFHWKPPGQSPLSRATAVDSADDGLGKPTRGGGWAAQRPMVTVEGTVGGVGDRERGEHGAEEVEEGG
ncbi:hypothetical protein VUR80DRAFT_3603 [Thermomyces stellatus]